MRSVLRGRRSRHGMSAFVYGLDVHRDSTYATLLDSRGKMVNQTSMADEGILSCLSHFGIGKVAMESSNQVVALHMRLKSNGYDVVLSHPRRLLTLMKNTYVRASYGKNLSGTKQVTTLAIIEAHPKL